MAQPLARVLIRIGVVWRLVHDADLHFTDAHARTRMIGNVEVARERAELLKLHLVDLDVLPERHGELQLTILASPKVLDRPLDAALRNVKVGPVWVFYRLLWLHHGLCSVDAPLGVDHRRLQAGHFLPGVDDGAALTCLVLLVDVDAQDLGRCLEAHHHLLHA